MPEAWLPTYKAMLNGDGLDERTSLFKGIARERAGTSYRIRRRSITQNKLSIGDSVKNMLYIASLDNYMMG